MPNWNELFSPRPSQVVRIAVIDYIVWQRGAEPANVVWNQEREPGG